MPKRKRSYRRRGSRKRSRSNKYTRYRRRRRRQGVPRGIIPDTRLVKHRYVDKDIYLNSTVGGLPATHVFSANGLYDSDITGVGHQSLLFDQMAALYNVYTVVGCKITYRVLSQDNGYAMIVLARLSTDVTPTANIENTVENGKCKYALIPRADGGVVRSLTLGINPAKFLGLPHPMSEPDLAGNAAANPVKQAYIHLSAAPMQDVDTYGVRGMVTIEYSTVWSSPKLIAES